MITQTLGINPHHVQFRNVHSIPCYNVQIIITETLEHIITKYARKTLFQTKRVASYLQMMV